MHSLDRAASGTLLFAKSQHVAQEVSTLFREKKVINYYVALSNKKTKKEKNKVG